MWLHNKCNFFLFLLQSMRYWVQWAWRPGNTDISQIAMKREGYDFWHYCSFQKDEERGWTRCHFSTLFHQTQYNSNSILAWVASFVWLHLYLFCWALHLSSPCAVEKVGTSQLFSQVTRADNGERMWPKRTSKQHSIKSYKNERWHWGKTEKIKHP